MNRIIRNRNLPQIYDFETGFNFRESRAFYDKCEINIDIGYSQRPIEDIASDFEGIGRQEEHIAYNGKTTYPILTINKKSPLLFRGEIVTYKEHQAEGTIRIRANLKLNPTRYFAHNPPDIFVREGENKLLKYDRAEQEISFKTYDQNDNYIEDARLLEAYETNWNDLTRELINNIRTYLRSLLEDSTVNKGQYSFYNYTRNWTIKHFEYYFEFKTNSEAKDIVHDFCSHLKSRFARIRETYHLNQIDRSYTSVSYIFDTGKENKTIAIYAKAPNRIRVECRYSANLKNIINDADNNTYNRGSEDSFFEFLKHARTDAIKTLREVKRHHSEYVMSERFTAPRVATALSTISSVSKNNQAYYKHMIQSYLDSNKVAELPNKDKYNAFLKELKKEGVLEPLRKRPNRPRLYRIKANFYKILKGR